MANDGKLYIIITDERGKGSGTGVTGADVPTDNNKTKEKKSGLDYAKHRFYSFIESQTKQAINYGINNIGNFTGDYATQREITQTMQGINILLNIGTSIWAGAKATPGSPVGPVVAAVIAIAGVGINAGLEAKTQRVNNEKINYNIEQLRKRSGLNNVLDGSRGTEN